MVLGLTSGPADVFFSTCVFKTHYGHRSDARSHRTMLYSHNENSDPVEWASAQPVPYPTPSAPWKTRGRHAPGGHENRGGSGAPTLYIAGRGAKDADRSSRGFRCSRTAAGQSTPITFREGGYVMLDLTAAGAKCAALVRNWKSGGDPSIASTGDVAATLRRVGYGWPVPADVKQMPPSVG